MSSWDRDGDSDGAEAAHTSNNLKSFLLAQSLSTLQFYWREYHDTINPQYLGDFMEGSSVAEMGWDGFLTNLMRAEPEELTIRKVSQKPRGGSGNNPYLSSQRHAHEYTVLIEPLELAKKIMNVREQVALEMISDLSLVAMENEELLRHHADTVSLDERSAEAGRQLVFDNDPWGPKTPYRGKNYTELLKLVTRLGVRRHEADLRASGRRFHSNWLERFLLKSGAGLEGNALLEAMLNGPMMMINPKIGGGSDKPRVIEPLQIAKGVMLHRAAAAEEFRVILGQVPGDHLVLKARMLEAQFAHDSDDLVTSPQRNSLLNGEA